jgi:coenzyme F420-dependent glucose-6-phosphate dehydrogenase
VAVAFANARGTVTTFGYHASHEQYAPSALLEYVRLATESGFDGVLSSDHFHPWLEENGHGGFGWSWLGAAMQCTTARFGTVCAPGDRYHPAIIAQAAATLAEMFPDRFWLAVGTGEALNEHITGAEWPPKSDRQARLLECVDVMRALWRGETVSHRGRIIVELARLYTLPRRPPALFGAAVSDATAEWCGAWADGLITTGRPPEEMARMIEAFHRGGGGGKPVFVQHVLSWNPSAEAAHAAARDQWRFATLDAEQLWNLRTPADFADATRSATAENVASKIRVSSDLGKHAEWLNAYADVGVEAVFCLNVGKNQREFIEAFSREVLPVLKGNS